ncbi:MAG TPA: DUF2203 domain-containing protein [Gemmatimonadaceae bacterium]|nr:DUF2203 domain-containing protein [Gemmatimonadaceae bacterium]
MIPTPRRFTVEQANRMLPLVGRIVRDIVQTHRAWARSVQEFELAAAESRADRPSPRAEELQRETQRLAAEIQGFMGELRELDVEFKGFELGLVDFPSELDGRLIYLCWKLGEESVAWWHEVEDGFAGRQPLIPMLQGS